MGTKKKVFDGLFAGIQDINNNQGEYLNTVLFTKNGDYSVIFEIENGVQQYSTDADLYFAYIDVFNNIIQTIGEGFCLQKQDVLCRQKYHQDVNDDADFLSKSYFRYFEGREHTQIRTFVIITQKIIRSTFVKYDPKVWDEFHAKITKVEKIFQERHIPYYKLKKNEVNDYLHRFMAFNFRNGSYSLSNIKASDEYLRMGEKIIKSFSLVDVDEINTPTYIKPYQIRNINGYNIATDLFSFMTSIPDAECVVYNQVIQIPAQRRLMQKLHAKAKRHDSMPDTSNKIAKADIDLVLEMLEKDSKMLVYTNFNMIVSYPCQKNMQVCSYIETKLYECGITASKSAYNQLELFSCSFPGNSFAFNQNYDLFLTLSDAALCFLFKEHAKHSEQTPLKIYYTDRQGLPVAIDITGKEGRVKMTDNANFFCLGPSGSGKSFHMNSVVRQLLEQDTDVVMVDTGDSYEGICRYFKGTYITYSKEKPISMNPFKITEIEYKDGFGEKKNFLKSLIFLIFKGTEKPTKVEDKIINQTIVEYYDAFFNPFEGYTEHERKNLRDRLFLEDKKNGKYYEYQEQIEETYTKESNDVIYNYKREGIKRKVEKLHNLVNDSAASDGEKENAQKHLMRLMPEVIENNYLMLIDKKIDKMEEQKRKLKVKNLSFNTYYEFVLERIPQIVKKDGTSFAINNFAAILEQFYKGGELEHTLNNDVDSSLFDEKFIVFEIDKIKDDPVLFPIVVLIIMDVFLQKMRIKKGRKALIIEEAWKAISSPTMAEYIKYLYKTVRKFHGIAGVVTQELNDVIDSPVVKEAIINNSDVKILLDQTKFKDRYEKISAILGLTGIQRKQIFTINSLNNKENRNYFKEVWICRGLYSDVYGVEEPPECYWAYTTERVEKEALKIYEKHFGNIQLAITKIEEDRKQIGINKYLEFAQLINKQQKIMSLWEN